MSRKVKIILDHWPETDSEFNGLIASLRFEYRVQADRRRLEANGSSPIPPLKVLYIHDVAPIEAASAEAAL